MKQPKNFARFYALLKQMPAEAKEGLKETLVASFTNNRTTSLKDMTLTEYKAMCNKMAEELYQGKPGQTDPDLKAKRSAVLTRLQRLGIDTANWDEVDKFCNQSRIAGKNFRELTKNELQDLIPKLAAIARKSPRNTKKYRPNYIVIDDLETDGEKTTPETQEKQRMWVEKPVIPDWQLRLMLQYMDKSTLN